ncbi:FAT1-like protein, partial [Mya arenaria]
SSISLLTVTDADGDALTITVAAGDDASNKFTFSSGNPKLIETSSNAIDYETLSGANYKYTLVVEATDGTNTGTATVIVTVTNVNEATPSFVTASFSPAYTSATTAYNIDETSAVGTSIVTVTASDADDGAAGEVEYSVGTITESTGSATTGIFGVDPFSGVLSTIVTTLDCDTATGGLAYYDVTIIASDKGSPVNSATIQVRVGLVDVNDNTPTFAQNVYTVSIPETTAATTSLLTLTATDDDVTAAALTFTLETSSSPSAYASKFELDSTTTNQLNLLAAVDLDAGDASSYILVVSVADGGSPALTSTTSVIVTVTAVNDAAPSVTGATVAIDESTAVGGAVITVAATDADTGADGDLTFSISLGNSAGKFAIDPTTAAISVAGSLDYETTTQYLLTVKATDGGSTAQTGSATITVNINDISDEAPTCSANSYYVSIDEPGVISIYNYVTLACTDTDAVDTLTYSIASGNTGTTFSISASGVITLASALDYDAGTQNFALSVQVTDGTNTLTIPVTVDVNHVNEAAPSVTGSTVSYVTLACTDTDAVDTLTYSIASGNTGTTFSISASGIDETTVVGSAVTTVVATDADGGIDGDLTYTISLGNSAGKFNIDPTTGAISVTGSLDFETTTQYLLTVKATDGGSPAQTGSATITVNINDISDQAPTCSTNSYQISIDEPGTVSSVNYVSLACTDTDAVDTLTYSIASGNTGTTFSISASGEITLASALDYDAGTQNFALSVQVTDGTNTLTIPVTVDVNHVNEAAPSVTGNTVSIDESTVVGGAVTTVAATDADAGNDGDLTYSIILGNSAGKFDIDPTTGAISVTGSLDYETTTQYLLTVQATDGGSPAQTGSATVTVNINDISDQAPTCSTNSYQISIDEPGTVSSVNYVSLACTDTDAVDTLTYSIASGNIGTAFSISASGVITLASALDYDLGTQNFALSVQVTDGTNTLTIPVTVDVNHVNEAAPSVTGSTVSIDESTAVGGAVTTVVATDADGGIDGDLTYSISLGNSAGKFDIDPTTGDISVTGSLDYETTTQYLLTVQATDGGSPAQTGSATVTYVSLACTDADAVDTLTYSIASGNIGTAFSISASGVITLASALDYDAGTQNFALSVQVTDGTNTLTIPVTVDVNHVNEAAPSVTGSSISIDESTAVGGAVTTVVATDADGGIDGDLTYSISLGNSASKFDIDPTSGAISVTGSLDYETTTQYLLTVQATDGGSPTQTGSATVTYVSLACIDTDAVDTLTYSIASGNTGTTFSISASGIITLASALDYDAGSQNFALSVHVTDGTNTLTIPVTVDVNHVNEAAPSVTGSTVSVIGNSAGKFNIDPTTGAISVTGSLDFETTTQYLLTVKATDGGSPAQTGSATITVNINDISDEAPTCSANSYYVSIDEPGVISIYNYVTLACTDTDAVDTLTYSIASGNTGSKFSISTAGVITLASALDYDAGTQNFALSVQVTDGTTTLTIPVTMDVSPVNEATPTFGADVDVTFAENTAVGTSLATHAATDADASPHAVVSYSISSVTNSGSSKFSIDQKTGELSLAQMLDYETATSYVITVIAVDGGSPTPNTGTGTVTIQVSDVNDNVPTCSSYAHVLTVAEDTAVIPDLGCADADGTTPTYTIATQTPASHFSIDTSGATPALVVGSTLNYQTYTSYAIEITVSDDTVYVDISITDVNSGGPSFSAATYTTSIAENTAVSTSVFTVTATDPDLTTSTYGKLTYSITAGNTGGVFVINPTTGRLSVSGVLDTETTPSYSLTVQVSEETGGNTDTSTLTITVTNVNDNTPTCTSDMTFSYSLAEEGTVGDVIHSMTCTDADGDSMTYTISSGSTTYFQITGTDLMLKAVIDYETSGATQYDLTVDVSDGTYSVDVTGSVVVTPVNEVPPTFTSSTSVSVLETETVGTSVYQAVATDTDTGGHGDLRYYIRSGNTGTAFSINSFTGDVFVANSLDYDSAPTSYTLEIEAEDMTTSNSDTRTSTLTLAVTLTDDNDQTPTFTQDLYTTTLDENVATSTSVLTVTATDTDAGASGTFTFSVIMGTGSSLFTVASSTGVITTTGTIDYETLSTYDLVVQAIDGGTSPLSSTCFVRISINDMNDNTPVFPSSSLTVSITESSAVGTAVATAAATDDDSVTGNNNIIVYSFSTASAKFSIDSSTGSITTIDTLDRETAASYTLVVYATDQGSNPQQNTGSVTYTVVLNDENDNDPVVQNIPYDTTIAEDATLNTAAFTISVTDADENENAYLTYSLTSGNTNSDFSIDSGSGLLQVVNTLDRETTDVYYLEVTIVDAGAVPRSAIVTATVTVSDVNDNYPIFQPDPTTTYSFSVSEQVPSGSSVDSVSATDADINTNGAVTFYVAYFLAGDSNHFVIDSSSGAIATAATLDRETQDTYVLVVRAIDGGTSPKTATATVSITILDYNDNTPSYSQTLYTGTVTENVAAGTSILTVSIDDLDINMNSAITLSIADSTADMYIAADSITYILSVKTPIDRETVSSFDFVLTATDGGTPPLSFTTQVQITVNDVNDNAPIFTQSFYNSEIAYNDACQVTAATLTATDADTGVNADFTFSVTQNDHPEVFLLDSQTGDIVLASTATAGSSYQIYATATDSGTPPMTSANSATVRVDAYNPNTVVLNYYMGISKATFLSMESTFLSQLTTLYQATYSTSEAKRWCVEENGSNACIVRVYVIKDDTADAFSELANDKVFLSVDEAYAITALDDVGTPSSGITGSSWTAFSITRVEKYYTEEENTPWIETTAGIITVSVVCGVAFLLIVAGIAVAMYKYRKTGRGNILKKSRAEEDEERTDGPRKTGKPKPTEAMIKPYDKSHPPPAVVALPMPEKHPAPRPPRRDELKKQDSNGSLRSPPTPIRATNNPPSKQPHGTPPKGGTRTGTPTNRVTPTHTPIDSEYIVLNRKFDGRAIDPVSGRVYEYNTQTNERRRDLVNSDEF